MPVTLEDICDVPAEASLTLRAISRVAEPCCSIDAAIEAVIPLISAMVCAIASTAVTELVVDCCISPTLALISSVAFASGWPGS